MKKKIKTSKSASREFGSKNIKNCVTSFMDDPFMLCFIKIIFFPSTDGGWPQPTLNIIITIGVTFFSTSVSFKHFFSSKEKKLFSFSSSISNQSETFNAEKVFSETATKSLWQVSRLRLSEQLLIQYFFLEFFSNCF